MFYDAISSQTIRRRMVVDWWVGRDLKRSRRGADRDTIPVFACRGWGKPTKKVRITCVPTEIRTEHFPCVATRPTCLVEIIFLKYERAWRMHETSVCLPPPDDVFRSRKNNKMIIAQWSVCEFWWLLCWDRNNLKSNFIEEHNRMHSLKMKKLMNRLNYTCKILRGGTYLYDVILYINRIRKIKDNVTLRITLIITGLCCTKPNLDRNNSNSWNEDTITHWPIQLTATMSGI
jgi:hypothetical protein